MNYTFQSGLAKDIQSMIDYKVSIGYSATSYLSKSISFDKYCIKYFPETTQLTKEVVIGWLEQYRKETSKKFHGQVSYIRGLGKYLKIIGKEAYILPEKFTSCKTRFIPYIFTDKELSALFHSIDTFHSEKEDELQPYLFSTMFRMIYTCGLRPKEGRTLKRKDINLTTGEVLITETKYHKERIVIMSDDMRNLCVSYAELRDMAYPDSPYFFPNKTGDLYSASYLQKMFKKFFELSNPMVDKELLPSVRIYDLRHRFASARLNQWLDNGEDLFSKLPYLRTYMGHTNLSSTVYYIHLLPENLVKSAGIDWNFLRQMIPEVELWDE